MTLSRLLGVVLGFTALLAMLTSVVLANQSTLTVDSSTGIITWDTGDGSSGQVYVSVEGQAEEFVAEGARGTVQVPWLAADKRYDFTLYAGVDRAQRLVTTAVGQGGSAHEASQGDGPLNSTIRRVADRFLGLHVVPLALAGLALATRGWITRCVAVIAVGWALIPALTTLSVPLQNQPFPDAAEYADTANHLAHGDGFVTDVHGCCRPDLAGPQPSRYPPGFSLALVPFADVGNYPNNVQSGARLFALLYVVVTAGVAWLLGGAAAASLTALFIFSAPFASVSGSLVLSDAFAACVTAGLVVLARATDVKRGALAGILAGAVTTVRLSSGIALPALLLSLRGPARWAMIAGAAPFLLGLGLFQWLTFGSPFRTGYDFWLPGAKYFDLAAVVTFRPFGDGPWILPDRLGGALMRWICPCADGGPMATAPDVILYPAVLLGLFWTFTPPLVTLAGLVYLWRHRHAAYSQFTLAVTMLTLIFYCVYFYQGARFMAAPATLLAIFSGVAIATWVEVSRDSVRGHLLQIGIRGAWELRRRSPATEHPPAS